MSGEGIQHDKSHQKLCVESIKISTIRIFCPSVSCGGTRIVMSLNVIHGIVPGWVAFAVFSKEKHLILSGVWSGWDGKILY